MGYFSKLYGTISAFFQVGGPSGPGINANGAALETKNAANTAYAVHRGAPPAGDNDFVTKAYADKVANKPTPCSLQFNGGTSLPTNSSTEQWYVVTTAGTSGAAAAVVGTILWDDGSNSGPVTVIPATTGNTIGTTAAFAGGTISLAANQLYMWSGSVWIALSPSISGATYRIKFAIGTGASTNSVTQIPANAFVSSVMLDVTTPYSAGATISIGQSGSTALLMGTADNVATLANQYVNSLDQAWGASALAALVTIAGSPAAGAASVVIDYCVPNS